MHRQQCNRLAPARLISRPSSGGPRRWVAQSQAVACCAMRVNRRAKAILAAQESCLGGGTGVFGYDGGIQCKGAHPKNESSTDRLGNFTLAPFGNIHPVSTLAVLKR